MRRKVKYNDVDTYRYLTVLGITGAYIEEHIQVKTLPEGFFHYELQKSKDRTIAFSAIGNKVRFGYCGDFITKEALKIPERDTKMLSVTDWSFADTSFEFESFFGMKLSITKQIQDAEVKRDSRQNRQAAESTDKESTKF